MKSIHHIVDIDLKPTSRILVIMPHPDDEAVFIGGLLQKITNQNINLKVITLTAGEKSTLRYGLTDQQDLAAARRQELNHALTLLGVKNHEVWDFPDGGLETHQTQIQARLKQELSSFNPTHLITLEPDGIYGHPDHIATSYAVTAIHRRPVKLLYATVKPNYTLPSASKMAKKSRINPIAPDYKINLITSEAIKKIQSLQAHQSQFKISLFHPQTILFFLKNDMLFHEYYTYRS